ncbi:uncharacterized protein B0H18DRAFT_1214570 [Fomitopsis serialis]|uniref:uncharacterized protein n=1 Tax=Fomitopsis serialis TaxID=139415 RepID=UPI002007E9EB|nr:uncharacterized protein B0H18DRAFT_1214570 [Neoantrodia serialis]KAH9917464.1 hypothetical protein B0H18DRAFT_1214570 [Neoantrodia serialis]
MSAPLQQRVHFLLGVSQHKIDDTGDPRLPDLGLIRQDVAITSAVVEAVDSMPEPRVLELQDPHTGDIVQEPASRSLVLKTKLPWLFTYSFLIHISDVPEDIHEHVIWALETFIDALIDCTDVQLVALYRNEIDAMYAHAGSARVQFATPVDTHKFCLRQQAKAKLTLFLLKPEVDRPGHAAQYFSEIIEFQRQAVPPGQFFTVQRDLLMIYTEALTRSGVDDDSAQLLLEGLADSPACEEIGLRDLIVAKVWLSRVLRRRGKLGSAKKHEKWLVKWFRKNPHRLPAADYGELLTPSGEAASPILGALGVPSWLAERQDTDKTIHRHNKTCRQCQAVEPIVKLSVCGKCKMFYYCSRECQRKDWPLHKNACKDFANQNEELELLSLLDAPAAQRQKDWNACKLADRLQKIVKCAVFRIADVVTEIEHILKLRAGEGRELCETLLHDSHPTASELVLFLTFGFGDGIPTKLMRGAIGKWQLKYTSYNKSWRQAINKDIPPTQLVLRDDIKDAELD